ncbi:RNase P subunit p30 family protein [Haloprofundus halophilus]|uniref:RNase P subunit p30 family protein n=1 Tax=Haloprofundus halophilus TaxID=2283527 RepID=UPI000E45095A|nr:RNase P subunit p30 family protein [Haloprofundus halophilus]
MYEAVHAYPDGDSTPSRFARTAAHYGFEGVVVRSQGAPDLDACERASDRYNVDVVDAVEVVAATPEQASGAVGNFRPKTTLLVLRGGDDKLNRFATEQERIDVLSRPMSGGDFNHVLAKSAKRNGVRVEFDFRRVLRADGGQRVQALKSMRKLRELVEYYDVPFVVSANPSSHLQLRAPRELVAVGERVGFTADQVKAGLREWGRLAARNRERTSESFIAPGVKRGRYEEDC